MKLTKTFKGVPDGAIYPVIYKAGDECPEELQEAAKLFGAFEEVVTAKKTAAKKEAIPPVAEAAEAIKTAAK